MAISPLIFGIGQYFKWDILFWGQYEQLLYEGFGNNIMLHILNILHFLDLADKRKRGLSIHCSAGVI